jgi:hypothetical protein
MDDTTKIVLRVLAGIVGLYLLAVSCHSERTTVRCDTYGDSVTCVRS